MTIKYFVMLLLLIQFSSCAQNLGNRDEAKKINNSAMEFAFVTTDSSIINNSIKMLDEAIALDSSCYIAYSNKVSLLFRLNRNLEVLLTLNHLSKFVGENALILFTRGIAYKKIGNKSLSDTNLMSALKFCSELKNTFDKTMYFQLLVYFESKKTALNKLNELLNVGAIKKEEFSNLSDLIQSIDESDPLGIEN